MKRFIGFGSIDQFRTVTKNVQHQASYQGQDENDEPLFNKSLPKPIVTAYGTEKIHGTNAAVCYSHEDGFWVQSRKNIITPEKDNAGCAFAVMANQDEWLEIIYALADENDINLDKEIISVYFEWSGGNIQKNSACSGVDKRAIIFKHFKASPIEPQTDASGQEVAARWLETKISVIGDFSFDGYDWVDNEDLNIFNICNFPQVEVEIDFNEPLMSQNKMIEMVEEIEKESLVGKAFGQEKNIGEGYVFTFEYKGNINRFKVKGEEHSKGSGKVKTLKPVDEEFENKKRNFVNDNACTEGRLNQMFTEIVHSVHNGDETLITKDDIRTFLQLMFKDIVKEEMDTMQELGLEPKSINGMVSKVAVGFFDSELDRIAGM